MTTNTHHVALGLRELHLVHALARVPVQEGLAAEHGRELLADALEHLLHGGAVWFFVVFLLVFFSFW